MNKRTVTETQKSGPQYRYFTVQRDTINKEARTADLAFSSETEFERWDGVEVLDHAPKSIRLGRLKDAGALLLDHDPRRHIGVVEQVEIGSDRTGRAVVRFGRSAEAEAAFNDVVDGIRQHVSVGYFVHRKVFEERGQGVKTDKYRVVDWEPFEISLVAIPADPTVGVGRAELPEVQTVVERTVEDEPPLQPEPKRIVTMEPKQKEPAELEIERRDMIATLRDQYAKYVTERDASEAIRNGKSRDQFIELIMERMQSKHTDTRELHIGMSGKEVQRYSLGKAVRAMVLQDWTDAGFERECSQAVEKMMGKSPEGLYVPFDLFRRDFNVGTAAEAGNLVATDLRGDLYVDALRNALVVGKLGVRILAGLTGNVDIPRKATVSSIAMLTERGSSSETQPATAKLSLTPKRFGAYVEVSKQAIIQSAIPLEGMIRDDLLSGGAVLMEDQFINGVGTGANMRGIRNTTGIGTVVGGANGAAPAWSHFVDLESACANANAEPDRLSGYLINTKIRGKAKQTQKATNLPFIWDNGEFPLNGYRAAVTNNVPSNLTKGTSTTICSAALFGSDWSMAVLGLFGAPDVTVDPYTKADEGAVKITLNQFADGGARQPGAFSKIDDLLAN